MAPKNLLILSDSAAGTTGLGRIARELANRIHSDLSDVFRVGVAGVGGNYSSKLPYPNYPIQNLQSMVPMDLPRIWQDFAGDEPGITLTIWNLAWVSWLACPERLPVWHPLREFLLPTPAKPESLSEAQWAKFTPQMQRVIGKSKPAPFKKWLYCPVDGDLPDGTMGKDAEPVLKGFDRVLAYTKYGAGVIARTLRTPEIKGRLWESNVPSLPHGLDSSVFYPRDKAEARRTLIHRLSEGKTELPINNDVTLLGCVATNSFRKDWGLAFETAAELLKKGLNVFLWGHSNGLGTDGNPQLYWNLLGLANQFGLGQRVILTTHNIADEDMAWCYSACDCTLGIGSEGWGYPLAESLACGVPVVHMSYAGGTDYVPEEYQVDAPAYRLESKWMIRRPSFVASEWADRVIFCLTPEGKALAKLPDYIRWENAWPEWKQWLVAGVNRGMEAPETNEGAPADLAASNNRDSAGGD